MYRIIDQNDTSETWSVLLTVQSTMAQDVYILFYCYCWYYKKCFYLIITVFMLALKIQIHAKIRKVCKNKHTLKIAKACAIPKTVHICKKKIAQTPLKNLQLFQSLYRIDTLWLVSFYSLPVFLGTF